MSQGLINAEMIFTAARAMRVPGERIAYLNGACGDNLSLRKKVDALLRAEANAGVFLAETTANTRPTAARQEDCMSPSTTPGAGVESEGSIIGSYKLLQQIGEGGFGVVYMAEQQSPVVRRVALKIIKPGMDTREVVARFEAERQALAMMDHFNIAHVFDAGQTSAGRPYFVMELVRGVPITQFCDEGRLGIRDRLRLFVPVCRAVQHAHTKGVIHRDLKPGNVMVTMHDDKPVAKVIDFGIAKAINQRLTGKTLFTRFQNFVGTPAYMSPEQAQMSGLDVDTRSDVYSLGALLYELLTGAPPFDSEKLMTSGLDEMRRAIREDEPPRPSTRVDSAVRAMRSAPTNLPTGRRARKSSSVSSIADLRRLQPPELVRNLRGELDWIVMKAMEKDRTRRYETANSLADDIEHYLDGKPVSAAPPRVSYRIGKFVRRHRFGVAASSAVALALIVGFASAVWGYLQASGQRDIATKALAGEQAQRDIATRERDSAQDLSHELRRQLYSSLIGRAQQLIEMGGQEPVQPILQACEEDLRGWEWQWLNWLADRSDKTLAAQEPLSQFDSDNLEYSSDGARFFTFGGGHVLRIWNANSFAKILEISDPHSAEITTARFSPDGRLIAAGDREGFFHVFDSNNGAVARTVKVEGGWPRAIAISPDNELLATGTWLGPVIIWRISSGEKFAEYGGDKARGQALQFSRDGNRLLIGSLGNSVSIVDLTTGETEWSERGSAFVVNDAALSPDETKVASIGEDSRLWMRDAHSGRLLYSISTRKTGVRNLAFHPEDDLIAIGGIDGIITFYSTLNGEQMATFAGHGAQVRGVAFHPDGRRLLSIDGSGVVKSWHVASRSSGSRFTAGFQIWTGRFSPDDSMVYLGGGGQGMQIIDARSIERVHANTSLQAVVSRIRISPDGNTIAATGRTTHDGDDWILAVYDPQGSTRASAPIKQSEIAFSKDGRFLAGLDEAGALTVRNAADLAVVVRASIPPESYGPMLPSEEENSWIIGGKDGRVRLVDSATGSINRTIEVHSGRVTVLLLSPDGDRLITGNAEPADEFKIWSWPGGELQSVIPDAGKPASAAISPDGNRLVGGGWDLVLKLWSLETGDRLANVGRTSGLIQTVEFSHDGKSILMGGNDQTLTIFETEMPSSEELERRYKRDIERRDSRRRLFEINRPQTGATGK